MAAQQPNPELVVSGGLPRVRLDATLALIAGLTVLAFALAAYHLGAKSLGLDEAVSVAHAQLGLHGLWEVVSRVDPNMGLYYVLLHFWVQIFGNGEAAVRSLSVVLAACAVPVMIALGWRLFGRTVGLIAGLLLALNPYFLEYEQTARSYGLLVLLVLLSSYFFVRALERPTGATLLGYVLCSVLAIYAQYFSAFVLLVQLLTLVAVSRRDAFTRPWVLAGATTTVLCVPEVVFALRKGTGGISWLPEPSLHGLLHLPVALAGGTILASPLIRQGTSATVSHIFIAAGLILAVALMLLACWGFLRSVTTGRVRWQTGFVAAWLLAPVFLAFVISRLGQPIFETRYLIIALPALLLLAALGISELPSRGLGATALVALVALLVLGIRNWYAEPSYEAYREATRYVLSNERQDDGAVYYPLGTVSPGMSYYTQQAVAAGPAQVGYSLQNGLRWRPTRLWLVIRANEVETETQQRIENALSHGYGYERIRSKYFEHVTVILYQHATLGSTTRP
jgi:uncharacterized membrane protein